ncbi:GH25 family lysozyme [Weissella sp. GP1]|uniref:GH25 family lysozyme n=1 Tax=Weissella confusa TaxID=1583 RepID=UPI0032DA92F7
MNKSMKLVAIGAAFLFGTTLLGAPTAHADGPRMDMVDVSNWNGYLSVDDFVTMRNAGVKAVTVKISEGTWYKDPTAANNIANAQAAGLYVNGYYFAYATDNATAVQEANYASAMAQADGLVVGAVLAVDAESPDQMAIGPAMQPVNATAEAQVRVAGGYRSTTYTMSSHLNTTPDGDKTWVASYPYNATADMNWFSSEHSWQHNDKQTFAGVNGTFDVSQNYDDFFTANQQPVVANNGETVWPKNGVWYTDQSFKNKANGIVKHMGSYWSFRDGKLVTSDWTKAWGNYYWSAADGRIVQGEGDWHGYHFNFGTDGTFNAKSATVTDLDSIIN